MTRKTEYSGTLTAEAFQSLGSRMGGDMWRSVLENPLFGISLLDRHQRFITANQAFRNMVGYTDDELRRMTALDISVAGEREINEKFFSEVQQGKRQHFEMVKQLRRKDGKLIWIQLYVFAIPDRETGAQLTFGMSFEITEAKQAQDALQETRTELTRVARMNRMGVMTGSIAHEINQPLGAIVANANAGLRWLSRPTPDLDETRAALQRIVRDGHHAAAVIKDIRSMFMADYQSRALVDLNELIREVVALTEGEIQKRPIVLHTELDEKLPLVMADRVQMKQVMFNLITNAIDAMDSVTDRNRILRISSEAKGSDEVLIAIEDSGTGIAPENIDRIFSSFFTTKSHGSGMGLPICRSIVEAHEGRLWVESALSHGTVFRISLPTRGRIDYPTR